MTLSPGTCSDCGCEAPKGDTICDGCFDKRMDAQYAADAYYAEGADDEPSMYAPASADPEQATFDAYNWLFPPLATDQ